MKQRRRPEGFEKHPERINRKGRPKTGYALAEVLRAYLDEPSGHADRTRKQHLAERLYAAATARNVSVAAARLIFETVLNTEIDERLERIESKLAVLEAVKAQDGSLHILPSSTEAQS
ncbi:MAG: hypothetical protein ABSG17_13350 [Spirochaetia bacterium]